MELLVPCSTCGYGWDQFVLHYSVLGTSCGRRIYIEYGNEIAKRNYLSLVNDNTIIIQLPVIMNTKVAQPMDSILWEQRSAVKSKETKSAS
jgi:hypothetical protein